MSLGLKLCVNMFATNLSSMQRQRCFHYLKSSLSITVNPRLLSSAVTAPKLILKVNSGAFSHVGFKFIRYITKFSSSETDSGKIPLSKQQAHELVLKLTEEEQKILLTAIQTFQSEKMRQEFQGQLAGWRWRSKLGRPTKLPKLGDTDPTGSFCPVPEDWITKKYAETQPAPTPSELAFRKYFEHLKIITSRYNFVMFIVGLHNALPFIGFGFLDNFIMIVAGDYIDLTIGLTLGISTMAAAALGNTISDVAGIGSAWYVENLVTKFGFKPPPLSPIQLDMKSSRRVANMGRAIGVSLGCLLGMLPLLFLPTANKHNERAKQKLALDTVIEEEK